MKYTDIVSTPRISLTWSGGNSYTSILESNKFAWRIIEVELDNLDVDIQKRVDMPLKLIT